MNLKYIHMTSYSKFPVYEITLAMLTSMKTPDGL